MSDDEPRYSKTEVTRIVQRRLALAKFSALPDEVQRELLRSILERLDVLEARLNHTVSGE